RTHHPLLYFIFAPLAALPVFMANALRQALLSRPAGSALALWLLSRDNGFIALVWAYVLMLFLGLPTISFLRWGERFHRRSLEIAGSLLGGLALLPSWRELSRVNDGMGFLSFMIGLAA